MAEDEYEEEMSTLLLKEQLIAELDAARVDLRRAQNRLAHRLDVKHHAGKFLTDKRPVLIASAIPLAGLFLRKLLPRKRTTKSHRAKSSLIRTGAGLIVGMVIKPYLRQWATAKAKSYLRKSSLRLP